MITIGPQEGQQQKYLQNRSDICIYGGAAGGGKSYAILLEPFNYIFKYKDFGCVIFRRTFPEITGEGGLWEEAMKLYSVLKAKSNEKSMSFTFKNGNKVSFSHLQHEKDRYKWQGKQIALIQFDELTHFTESQFFYLLSRNRSTCGVKPYVRATCNPDADSWVRKFIDWWVGEDGYPIKERDSVERYFIRVDGNLVWRNSKEELIGEYRVTENDIKSVSFIHSTLQDNQILMEANPQYLSNLKALPKVERDRLLYGNWNIREESGTIFNRSWFEIKREFPPYIKLFRFWDLAATEKKNDKDDPDYTATALGGIWEGVFYVKVERDRLSWKKVKDWIKNLAIQESEVHVGIEQEPGATGKGASQDIIEMCSFAGRYCKAIKPTKDKVSRALPLSSLSELRQVVFINSHKTNIEETINEFHNFPDGSHDDMVDAVVGCYDMARSNEFNYDRYDNLV